MTLRLDFGTIHSKIATCMSKWHAFLHLFCFEFEMLVLQVVQQQQWRSGPGGMKMRDTEIGKGTDTPKKGRLEPWSLCVCAFVCMYVLVYYVYIHTYVYIYTYMDRLERPYVFSGTAHFACLNWASKCNWTKHDAESPDHFVYTSVFVCIYMLFYM